MKEFHENLYFVAMEAEHFGEILFFRTNSGHPAAGDNLFDLIDMDSAERLFVLQNITVGGEAPLVIFSDRRVFTVIRNMFYAIGICCFAEIDCDGELLCSMFESGMLGECIMSEHAKSVCRDLSEFDETRRLGAYMSFMRLKRKISAFSDNADPDRIYDITKAICEDMECELLADGLYAPVDFAQKGIIFGNAVYALFVLTMCFVSKIISNDRSLKLTQSKDGYFIGMSVQCDGFGAEAQRVMENLRAFVQGKDVYINIVRKEKEIYAEISPFYEDIGLRGVKNPLIIDDVSNTNI